VETSSLAAAPVQTANVVIPENPLRTPLLISGSVVAVVVLALLSYYNYLFFHSITEMTGVVTAITLFSVGWHTRSFNHNPSLTLLAIGFLLVGCLDLLHLLSYKGMGVFPGSSANIATQFWTAARSAEALSYVLAACATPWLRLRTGWVMAAVLCAGLITAATIWPLDLFPDCLLDGQGLTPFKIGAEYAICLLLAVAAALYWRFRAKFDPALLKRMLIAIGMTALSELAFTLYVDIYGAMNVTGHLLKLASIILVYRAVILGTLRTPYQGLFRDLAISHAELDIELQQRRKVENELRRANRDLDAFVRTASHDLRTPLTIITSAADLIRRQLPDIPAEQREMLQEISFQGLRMGGLLNDLLALARLGEISDPPQVLALEPAARRVIDDLAFEMIDNGATVHVATMLKVTAHPALLYQVLLNYIGNAVRYAAAGGPIEVCSRRQDERVVLCVRDQGKGVAEHERKRIFDVFYRGEAGMEREGTGIGLATVQRIASLYGGKAWVEETPGGGATFCIDLPPE